MVKRCVSFLMALIFLVCSFVPVSAENKTALPDKSAILSALYEADISAIRNAIDLQIITCEELTSYYLDRIESYNKNYNCFITLCDNAIDVAKERDKQLQSGDYDGLLFGIPVVVKDNINLEGYYTTNGHYYEDSEVATESATVVKYLLEQGAVIIGKTNMSTDAQDARSSYSKIIGETKNAYNTLLAAGGSSGGTAVSVSLNFAVAGLGTDTNSSLRIPAVLNGCVALRSTWNFVDYTGCTKLNGGRDVVGAVTRSVYDQAIMMDVITNGQYNYTQNLDEDALKGLKIGVLQELSGAATTEFISGTEEQLDKIYKKYDITNRTNENIDSEVIAAFNNAVKELESCGAEVKTVSMPNIWNLSYATFDDGHIKNKRAFYSEFEQFLKDNDIDAVIFPSYLSTPLKSGTDENGKKWNVWQGQFFFNNCPVLSPSTGAPEISVPIGYHSSGAGIGLEIASFKDSEQLLLNIAYSYEQSHNHRLSPSGAPNKYTDFSEGTLYQIIEKFTVTAHSSTAEDTAENTDDAQNTATVEPSTQNNTQQKIKTTAIVIPIVIVVALSCVGIIVVVIVKKRNKKL